MPKAPDVPQRILCFFAGYAWQHGLSPAIRKLNGEDYYPAMRM